MLHRQECVLAQHDCKKYGLKSFIWQSLSSPLQICPLWLSIASRKILIALKEMTLTLMAQGRRPNFLRLDLPLINYYTKVCIQFTWYLCSPFFLLIYSHRTYWTVLNEQLNCGGIMTSKKMARQDECGWKSLVHLTADISPLSRTLSHIMLQFLLSD